MNRFLYHVIATAAGCGYAPLAPGTAGSIGALLLIYCFYPPWWVLGPLILVLFFLGVYTSTQMEKIYGPDPSLVVMDEVVGMSISLFFLPRNYWLFLLAFIFFRFYDIVKPPPINISQQLPGGWGIMIDDVIAGIFALITVQVCRMAYLAMVAT